MSDDKFLIANGTANRQNGIRNLKLEIKNSRQNRAYTLIEMLISVTIFSGLLIIVLGTVATSSSSSAKVSILREKSQAARTLIDQISNDLRYVDTDIYLIDPDGNRNFGYSLNPNNNLLVLAIRLPNTTENELVRKEYSIKQFNDRLTLTLIEWRGCKNDGLLCDGASKSKETDLLSSAYALDQTTTFPSQIGGISPRDINKLGQPISPYVSMVFSLKPVEFINLPCTDRSLDADACYKVSTSLNMGER